MVDKLLEKENTNLVWHIGYEHIFSFFEQRDKKQYFLDLCGRAFTQDSVVYICCSGGPDSMFLSFFLIRYRHYVKGQQLSITKILHINHNTSSTDFSLQEVVFQNFSRNFEIKHIVFERGLFTETKLRKMRWEFFTNNIQESLLSGQSVYLCLGHNLDDRIENSFLHFDRGVHLPGIVNMQQIQKKTLFQKHEFLPYICFRPLLSFSKNTIHQRCNLSHIPYVEDVHNLDLTQKRIQYRSLIQKLSEKNQQQLYNERSYVYTILEKEIVSDPVLQKLSFPDVWNIDCLYKAPLPTSLKELVGLLVYIHIFTNMSTPRLEEIMKWFRKKQGAFFLSGRWFLCAYDEFYIAKQQRKNKFREREYILKQPIVSRESAYSVAGYTRVLDQKKFVGSIITFPSITDRVGKISYNKRAAKQHIPFFWRSALPIIKKNSKILAVLPSLLWPWKT